MSYLSRIPSGLRHSLSRSTANWVYQRPENNLIFQFNWEYVCSCGSSRLVLWYYHYLHADDLGPRRNYPWPDYQRNLNHLFEWDSAKLIERLLELNDLRMHRDLATAAVREGKIVLFKRILDIFEDRKLQYWYSKWGCRIFLEIIGQNKWELVRYLLARGFRVYGYVLDLHMSAGQLAEYMALESEHYKVRVATHYDSPLQD